MKYAKNKKLILAIATATLIALGSPQASLVATVLTDLVCSVSGCDD